jgi:Rhodopirellula transposase.
MFKKYMQDFADETGLEVHVCHYPRGTSKWNPIEHKLFSHISRSMQAKPLLSISYAVNAIASTTTKTGLSVKCEYDSREYSTGQTISDKDFKTIAIMRKRSLGTMNYYFLPKVPRLVPRARSRKFNPLV